MKTVHVQTTDGVVAVPIDQVVRDLYQIDKLALLTAVIDLFGAEIYETARLKGWYDTPSTFPERIAMLHSELSEALEEWRMPGATFEYKETPISADNPSLVPKPVGVASELADVLIRLFEMATSEKVHLARAVVSKMSYNKARSYRHGNKRL